MYLFYSAVLITPSGAAASAVLLFESPNGEKFFKFISKLFKSFLVATLKNIEESDLKLYENPFFIIFWPNFLLILCPQGDHNLFDLFLICSISARQGALYESTNGEKSFTSVQIFQIFLVATLKIIEKSDLKLYENLFL